MVSGHGRHPCFVRNGAQKESHVGGRKGKQVLADVSQDIEDVALLRG